MTVMMHADINANIYTLVRIINAINQAKQAT
jgi:hypothetical protein